MILCLQLGSEICLNFLTGKHLDAMLALPRHNADDRSPHGRVGFQHNNLTW